jgi:hypothetical protein
MSGPVTLNEMLIKRLRDTAQAYPLDIFPALTPQEREALPTGIISRISAGMGRHFSRLFTEAADALEKGEREMFVPTDYWRCPCGCNNYYSGERLFCPVSGDRRPVNETSPSHEDAFRALLQDWIKACPNPPDWHWTWDLHMRTVNTLGARPASRPAKETVTKRRCPKCNRDVTEGCNYCACPYPLPDSLKNGFSSQEQK